MFSSIINTPIIVDEHGDILIFETKEDVESFLEPIDVKNEEYAIYDGNGYCLQLTIEQVERESLFKKTMRIDLVKVTDNEIIDCSNELRSKLISFFQKMKTFCQEDATLSLQGLINKAVRLYGYVK